jgi:signal transduction histidine kinase
MRRPPIRIRTFLLGTVLVLLVVPTLAGGAAWLIERDHQQADIQRRLSAAVAYLTSHRTEMKEPASVHGFARLLDRLDLLSQLVIAGPSEKSVLYVSPALEQGRQAKLARGKSAATAPAEANLASWSDDQRLIPAGTSKSPATFATDLYYRPASRTTRALVALVSGIVVLLAGLAVAVWLAGRWMVAPLARLSAQVDKVAGGDLTIALPRSRIGEIANIAQAVEGMTDALGETAQRRAEADEARRFLVTSVAHDLRTPLFALRGHLQAIGSRLGNPAVHLERAEARADALERLIGNLFAYTRDDYAQPAPQLEAAPVADLLNEVVAGLEHTTRLRDNTFELEGDRTLGVIVDRDRVKRALTNILDNAVRYSPPGAAVHLAWAAADESTVQITVQDHGPGIDPNLVPHIFEPGIRGTPAADSADHGAGLGLAIAKRLLEHQHATITAGNEPGGGAAISLTLRRAPLETREERSAPPPSLSAEPPSAASPASSQAATPPRSHAG